MNPAPQSCTRGKIAAGACVASLAFFVFAQFADAAQVAALVSGTYTPGNYITVEPSNLSFLSGYPTGYIYVAVTDRLPTATSSAPACYDLIFDTFCGGSTGGTLSAPQMSYNSTTGGRVGTTTYFAWVYYPATTTAVVLGYVPVYIDTAGAPTVTLPQYGPDDAYIISVSPSWGSTTAGTTIAPSISYHNNGSYNAVGFNLINTSIAATFYFKATATPMTEGSRTATFPTDDLGSVGAWTGYAFMATVDDEGAADPATLITEPIYFFASATPEQAAAIVRLSASTTAEVQGMCYGKTGIDGILCKIPEAIVDGIASIFSPHQWSLDLISSLKETFGRKPPFGYISVANEQVTGLTESGSGVFSLAQEGNITDTIFDPLSDGIAWIMYLCAGLWIYKRLHHVDL